MVVPLSSHKVGCKDPIESHQGEVEVLFAALAQVVQEGTVQYIGRTAHHQFTADVEGKPDLLWLSCSQLRSDIGTDLTNPFASNTKGLTEEAVVEV